MVGVVRGRATVRGERVTLEVKREVETGRVGAKASMAEREGMVER